MDEYCHTSMEEKILKYLQKHPGAKAKELAEYILGNRQNTRAINQCLFYKLNGLVERYSSVGGWYLTSRGQEKLSNTQATLHTGNTTSSPNISHTKVDLPAPQETSFNKDGGYAITHNADPKTHSEGIVAKFQTDSQNQPMQLPDPEDFELTPIKLRLLENSSKYNELLKKVTEKAKQRDRSNERIFYIIATFFFIGICALAAYIINKDEWLYYFFCIFAVSFVVPIIPGLLLGLGDKLLKTLLVNGIDYFDTYEEGGWTWVQLTDKDRNNYQRYVIACDESSHSTFIINWNDISFQDGSVVITLKCRNQTIRYACNSKSFYTTYKPTLQSQFGQVEVEAKNGKYCVRTPNVIEESILLIIRHLELIEKERLARIESIVKANPEILNSSKNQTTIIITIKAQRSDYLNHLLNHQAVGISIIQTTECCSYATSTTDTNERAYVFVIKNRKGNYSVIYENANDDKASIVSTVDNEERCYECAVEMVTFMKSHRVNKRESLRNTHRINGFTVKSVNHDDIGTWKSNVTGDYYERKTTKRRFRIWRRR